MQLSRQQSQPGVQQECFTAAWPMHDEIFAARETARGLDCVGRVVVREGARDMWWGCGDESEGRQGDTVAVQGMECGKQGLAGVRSTGRGGQGGARLAAGAGQPGARPGRGRRPQPRRLSS